MYIGNIKIKGRAVLAPMAGVADRAFRELCCSFGASYCVGEMVSAKGVSMHDRKSKELMFLSDIERPAAIQIFGNSPETMAYAAKYALEFSPEIIDINMGCPTPKIVKDGSGAALMRSPQLAAKIIRAVVEAVNIPVTVKIRKGWDENNINALQMAEIAQENGAAALTIHGRTKEQMYAPSVDLNIIRAVKNHITIPVIGNGDIRNPQDAENMLEQTGCDLVMIGRGALGRPWLFSQINEFLESGHHSPDPDISERMKIMLEHTLKICQYHGERIGINESRKHALWYTKGIRGGAAFRHRISTVQTIDEIKNLAHEIIDSGKVS